MTLLQLLIVDDHPVFRQGLRDVFDTDPNIRVVGEAMDGDDAMIKALELHPDVVLMDINLPSTSGLQVTRRLKANSPNIKIVMITGYDEPEHIFHSLRAGASAFCSKDMPPEGLISTVHAVFSGDNMINGKLLTEEELTEWIRRRMDRYGQRTADKDTDSHISLSPREMEILELICQGASNKEIAQRLGISYQTVKNHVTALLHKLGVKDRTQAVLYALKHGWFTLEGVV